MHFPSIQVRAFAAFAGLDLAVKAATRRRPHVQAAYIWRELRHVWLAAGHGHFGFRALWSLRGAWRGCTVRMARLCMHRVVSSVQH
jgi:hypothetical protein